jgi:hypothetical protein
MRPAIDCSPGRGIAAVTLFTLALLGPGCRSGDAPAAPATPSAGGGGTGGAPAGGAGGSTPVGPAPFDAASSSGTAPTGGTAPADAREPPDVPADRAAAIADAAAAADGVAQSDFLPGRPDIRLCKKEWSNEQCCAFLCSCLGSICADSAKAKPGLAGCMSWCPRLSSMAARCHVYHCYISVSPTGGINDHDSHCGHAANEVQGGDCPTVVYQ